LIAVPLTKVLNHAKPKLAETPTYKSSDSVVRAQIRMSRARCTGLVVWFVMGTEWAFLPVNHCIPVLDKG